MSAEIFLKGNHYSKETLKQFLTAMDIKYDSNIHQKKYYIDLYNNAITNENNRTKLHNTNHNIINTYKCSYNTNTTNTNTNHKRHSMPNTNDINSVKDKQSSLLSNNNKQRNVSSTILKSGVLGIGGYMLYKPIIPPLVKDINNNVYPEIKSKVIEIITNYININKKLFHLAMRQINNIVTHILNTYTNEEIIVLFFILLLLLVLSYCVIKKIYLHYS